MVFLGLVISNSTLKIVQAALTGVVQLVWASFCKVKTLVQFLARAYAWVTGSVPCRGMSERQLIDVSLLQSCFCPSLSPSLPPL